MLISVFTMITDVENLVMESDRQNYARNYIAYLSDYVLLSVTIDTNVSVDRLHIPVK